MSIENAFQRLDAYQSEKFKITPFLPDDTQESFIRRLVDKDNWPIEPVVNHILENMNGVTQKFSAFFYTETINRKFLFFNFTDTVTHCILFEGLTSLELLKFPESSTYKTKKALEDLGFSVYADSSGWEIHAKKVSPQTSYGQSDHFW